MRKSLLGLTLGLAFLLSGCAASAPVGALYTDVKVPVTATANAQGAKTGTAICTSILGLVATGDCSVEAAAKNGGINKVFTVDSKNLSYLGVYATFTTTVTGQ